MPTYTEETKPYEFLIRFNDDDNVGAQYQTQTKVFKDGLVFSAVIDPPVQLAVLDGEAGALLSDLLGAATVSTLANNTALAAQVAQLNAAGEQLLQEFTESQGALEQALLQVQTLQAQIDALTPARSVPEEEPTEDAAQA
jgi:hypothetical protein